MCLSVNNSRRTAEFVEGTPSCTEYISPAHWKCGCAVNGKSRKIIIIPIGNSDHVIKFQLSVVHTVFEVSGRVAIRAVL